MKLTTENEFKGLLREFFKKRILESIGHESVDRAVRGEEDDYPEENEGPGTTYEAVGQESVDRSRRGEDKSGDGPHDYPEEAEGPATTYEHLKFEANFYHDADTEKVGHDGKPDLDETNLYTDADKEGTGKGVRETNLYHDQDLEKVPGKEDVTHASSVGNTHKKSLETKDSYSGGGLGETNLYTDSDKEGSDETKKKGKSHAAERGSKGNYPGPPAGLSAGKIPSLKDVFSEGKALLGLIEITALGTEGFDFGKEDEDDDDEDSKKK